ncbi:hexokinase [Dysgonomonas sp. 520]|uniref:hexokinase family protein n=1 Tax=Dysgonomonas sp. 520 TaxID=2302931 RepID=UPI0013D851E3|nr:hexokinase [Dysgonomonas sp. 520]NDW10309.1 hexokinase [Dysgonomonas sp. 520]
MERNIFELKTRQEKDIALSLQTKVEKGLKEDNTEIKCYLTYINPVKDLVEGKALVLDLGGTNFRAAVVEFKDGVAEIHPENGLKKNLVEYMKTEGAKRETLFEKMADLIVDGLNLEGVSAIGYCFSYPAESQTNGDAILTEWTKEVVVEGMIGELVGQPLLEYLNKKLGRNQFTSIKVINDTVASLFAGLTNPGYDDYIGLIVGTGTNMASFFKANKIEKLPSGYSKEGSLAVNLESGNFQPPHLTTIDEIVDASSDTKGKQRFEKAVSGMYLGKILKYTFPYDEFEDEFDAEKLTRIINYPDIHKKRYVKVARWIYKRSAQMVAASLAGLVSTMVAQDTSIKNILLTAEGSLFWSKDNKEIDYELLVDKELEKLLEEMNLDVKVRIKKIDNANLIGSAIAALS